MKTPGKTMVILGVISLCCPAVCLAGAVTPMPPVPDDVDPVPFREFWFSTEIGFTVADSSGSYVQFVSDGDLLSDVNCVVKTNHQLLSRFGILPPIPDLGLDAVTRRNWCIPADDIEPVGEALSVVPLCPEILFSVERSAWSGTQGWIRDGDLLSERGYIVRGNIELIDAFDPDAIPLPGVGLDAVDTPRAAEPVDTGFLFSVEVGFYSNALQCAISPGDLLAEAGFVYRTNAQLLANFNPYDPDHPENPNLENDLGLDAAYVTPNGTVWFSVEECFWDRNWGYVSCGDVLSETGRVVRRNAPLLQGCDPLENYANFGVDALHLYRAVWPEPIGDIEPEPIDP